MKKKKVAIIPARGGSKRIPNKNLRLFCGKPILAYSICAALETGAFDEVMVSTDSDEIARVAMAYGAKVPFLRSTKNSDDFATTADVLLEVLEQYKKRGESFDYMCCIYPTAPFVTAEKINEALRIIMNTDVVEVMPVVAFTYPPQRSYVINDGELVMKHPEHLRTRSQDLEKYYHECGQFYCYNVARYLECRGEIIDGILPITVSPLEVQDIDCEEDWEIAELKYQLLKKRREE